MISLRYLFTSPARRRALEQQRDALFAACEKLQAELKTVQAQALFDDQLAFGLILNGYFPQRLSIGRIESPREVALRAIASLRAENQHGTESWQDYLNTLEDDTDILAGGLERIADMINAVKSPNGTTKAIKRVVDETLAASEALYGDFDVDESQLIDEQASLDLADGEETVH